MATYNITQDNTSAVTFNGQDVTEIWLNGAKVWEKSSQPTSYEIWYTTTDGEIFELPDFGIPYEYTLVSNTYEDGKGVMKFDQPIEKIGAKLDEKGEVERLYPCFPENDTIQTVTIPNSVSTIYAAFIGCLNLTSVTIPDSVTNIGDKAFAYCGGPTTITIPNSVTSIGDEAFINCSNLTAITIPNSVTSIGNGAFYECDGLTAITIPNSVTSINGVTFYSCSNLTAISIPDSVTSIGSGAFRNCTSLTNVTYNGTIAQWNAITKDSEWKINVPSTCMVHCTDGDIAI